MPEEKEAEALEVADLATKGTTSALRWVEGTMEAVSDAWEPLVTAFAQDAYATVKGQVRTSVVHEHLCWHLPPPPAAVLDVGGGAGHQSLPLARMGYQVTLLDPSPAMLARANERLSGEPAEVRQRVEMVKASGEEAFSALGGRAFAGVLCHGVLMYVEDPAPLVGSLSACTAPGGVVSIVALNARTMAVRPALERRFADALVAFDTPHETGVLGVPTRADTLEGLTGLLEAHRVTREECYGVWLFSDWLDLAGVPVSQDEVREIARVELEASQRDPYRQMSRLFHLLGRKQADR